MEFFKCPTCEFECVSESLMAGHLERHELGLTELEEKKLIRKRQKEEAYKYMLSKQIE